MSQSQVLADDSFAAHMRHRDATAKAFLEELQGIHDDPDPKGGMSDATKRRLVSKDSSPRYTEWDQISMCGSEFPDMLPRRIQTFSDT